MLLYLLEPNLLRRNEWFDKLNPTVYQVEPAKKVAEIKELLVRYSYKGDGFIGFDNKPLIKWLCKLPNQGFYAGELFEPRDECKHLFDPGTKIFYVPQAINAWSQPSVYTDEWKYLYENILGTSIKYTSEWVDVPFKELPFNQLMAYDIETTGLNYGLDTIRTIGFSWEGDNNVLYKTAFDWDEVDTRLLSDSLVSSTEKVFHNATFDLTYLCRYLGRHPLEINAVTDTKLLSYALHNSVRGSDNSLEYLARRFLGSYKIDSLKAAGDALKHYNANDCAATLYLRLTLEELPFARKLHEMIPKIVGMQLTGWPLNRLEVLNLDNRLTRRRAQLLLRLEKMQPGLNPNSPKQLNELFFGAWKLDSYGKTASGNEETGTKALEFFRFQLEGCPEKKDFLDTLIEFKEVDKVAGSFLSPMLKAVNSDCFLRGSYNIGGTKSGRLSASDPNLQQFPSNSKYAKDFKKCFKPPKGWVLIGADYCSLEDRVSALTTRDPEKLKVYTDGYDGHCLRAATYFGIETDGSVMAINAIAKSHSDLRQKSKAPTFALTYQGTILTLVKNCGFSYEEAERIYEAFHRLYHVSDEWVDARLEQGKKDGYVNLAYGHRIKTPLLKDSIQGRNAPYIAVKERRTAANALGQSYCMVTGFTTAAMYRELYDLGLKDDILPVGEVHDACYWLVKDEPHVIAEAKRLMEKHMPNHGLPELEHEQVKLDIDAFIIRDSWANPVSL